VQIKTANRFVPLFDLALTSQHIVFLLLSVFKQCALYCSDEIYFVLGSFDVDQLKHNKEILANAEPLQLKLYRDAKVRCGFISCSSDISLPSASLAAELFRVLRRARETAVQVRVALGRQQLRFTGRTRIIARDANSWKSSVAKLHMFR